VKCHLPAPLLEGLSIHIADSLQEDVVPSLPFALFAGCTPRLASCAFASFDFGWKPSSLHGLRVLKLDGYWASLAPSTDELIALLRACPALEDFELRNSYDVDADIDTCGLDYSDVVAQMPLVAPAYLLRLPRLRRLSLCACGNIRTRALFAHFVLSALEDLELACVDDITTILGHIAGQGWPLRRLRIDSCSFSELQLVRLLRRIPDLASLEVIDGDDVSPHLLEVW
jgi:hypothetical protein